jgi:hypothetical protein
MTFIIGLTGVKRSGKDTAGKILANSLPGKTRTIAYADPLKRYAYDLNPAVGFDYMTDTLIYLQDVVDTIGWEGGKDEFPEIRKTLQRLGTEVFRRHVSHSYWTDLMDNEVAQMRASGVSAIITDCRFQNELDLVKSWGGGFTIRIERDSVAPDAHSAHASETGIASLEVDYVVQNNGTLDDLKAALGDVLHQATARA